MCKPTAYHGLPGEPTDDLPEELRSRMKEACNRCGLPIQSHEWLYEFDEGTLYYACGEEE